MSEETITPRQELFSYLSKELGVTALEIDLIAIERIASKEVIKEKEVFERKYNAIYQNVKQINDANDSRQALFDAGEYISDYFGFLS